MTEILIEVLEIIHEIERKEGKITKEILIATNTEIIARIQIDQIIIEITTMNENLIDTMISTIEVRIETDLTRGTEITRKGKINIT